MEDRERTIARAIGSVTYCPGIGTKRFAREMAFAAERPDAPPLTPKQRKYLLEVAVRYRRQIASEVVELARAMQKEGATT